MSLTGHNLRRRLTAADAVKKEANKPSKQTPVTEEAPAPEPKKASKKKAK